MITLDGSYGEGGGALVRTALALSALTGQEFTVTNIRKTRPEPGLKAQHLEAINALKQICHAETNDIELGSTELWFKPGKIKKGRYSIDIGTAGSISLLLQSLLLPCMFAPGKVTLQITGGTCGKWQASVDYLQHVLLPQLDRFVEKIDLKIIKRGYYPAGGGTIQLEITPRYAIDQYESLLALREELPRTVPKINLTRQGILEQIRGVVNLSVELEEKEVGERTMHAAETALRKYKVPINIRVEYVKALSIGGDFMLWALHSKEGRMDPDNPVILAGDALLEKQKSAEHVGKEAAANLQKELEGGYGVDMHLADQLILYMALLPGSMISVREISNHVQSNMYVAEQFVPIAFRTEKNRITSEFK